MNVEIKNQLISNMADNLPVLRKKLGFSQSDLAEMIGVSRSTITSIEGKKRPMSWNVFLSLILIFTKNEETDALLKVLQIYTDDLNEFIVNGSEDLQA